LPHRQVDQPGEDTVLVKAHDATTVNRVIAALIS
jgi:hypothetical protein